jgi:hypothetical protein
VDALTAYLLSKGLSTVADIGSGFLQRSAQRQQDRRQSKQAARNRLAQALTSRGSGAMAPTGPAFSQSANALQSLSQGLKGFDPLFLELMRRRNQPGEQLPGSTPQAATSADDILWRMLQQLHQRTTSIA